MKKLLKIRNILRQNKIDNIQEAEELLLSLGFINKKCPMESINLVNCSIWINYKKKIVVKANGLCQKRYKGLTIPTYKVGDLLIQPLIDVRRKSRRRAIRIFKKKFGTTEFYLPGDIKDDNVGFYRNKAVLHDW